MRTVCCATNEQKVFSKEKYGSLAKALKAAQEYRKEALKDLITNKDYLKLRNQHKEKSAKEFAEYLQKETTFKPYYCRRRMLVGRCRVVPVDLSATFLPASPALGRPAWPLRPHHAPCAARPR